MVNHYDLNKIQLVWCINSALQSRLGNRTVEQHANVRSPYQLIIIFRKLYCEIKSYSIYYLHIQLEFDCNVLNTTHNCEVQHVILSEE